MAGTDPSAGVQGLAAPSRGVALTPGTRNSASSLTLKLIDFFLGEIQLRFVRSSRHQAWESVI